MSNLTATMFQAADAMWAHRRGIGVAGHNVANANTPGFSRQRVELAARPAVLAGDVAIGAGVDARTVTRANDANLEHGLREADARFGHADARRELHAQLGAVLGDLEEGNLGARIDALFDAFRALSRQASGTAERIDVVSRARDVAEHFNDLARRLAEHRRRTDVRLTDATQRLNARAAEIAELNGRIAAVEGSGARANDLRDRRDRALRELAELADVSAFENERGHVQVNMARGTSLVDGLRAGRLALVADDADPDAPRVTLTTPGGVAHDVTARLREGGGRLGGLLVVRDVDVPAFQRSLDDLAHGLAVTINRTHAAGVGLDGIGGRALFVVPATAAGAAGGIRVHDLVGTDPRAVAAASDASQLPGDNRVAIELAELQSEPVVAGRRESAAGLAAMLLGESGEAQRRAGMSAELASATRDQAEAMRDALTGVSVDEEMLSLVAFQTAFSASGRVVSTVQRMMDTVLQLV